MCKKNNQLLFGIDCCRVDGLEKECEQSSPEVGEDGLLSLDLMAAILVAHGADCQLNAARALLKAQQALDLKRQGPSLESAQNAILTTPISYTYKPYLDALAALFARYPKRQILADAVNDALEWARQERDISIKDERERWYRTISGWLSTPNAAMKLDDVIGQLREGK